MTGIATHFRVITANKSAIFQTSDSLLPTYLVKEKVWDEARSVAQILINVV